MSTTMKLSTKVYLGFGATILICVILGIYGIFNFDTIRDESTVMSSEYVPEVEILSRLERNTAAVMYGMRGYTLGGNEADLKSAETGLVEVETNLKEAEELASRAPHLVKLVGAISSI